MNEHLRRASSAAYNFLNCTRSTAEQNYTTLPFVKAYYELLHTSSNVEETAAAEVKIPIIINGSTQEWETEGKGKYHCIRPHVIPYVMEIRLKEAYFNKFNRHVGKDVKFTSQNHFAGISAIYNSNRYLLSRSASENTFYNPPSTEDICIGPDGCPMIGELEMMGEIPVAFHQGNMSPSYIGVVRAYVAWKYFHKTPVGLIEKLPDGITVTGERVAPEIFKELDKFFEVVHYTSVI